MTISNFNGWYNDDWFNLEVYKCATSSMGALLPTLGWKRFTLLKGPPEDRDGFCLVREPIERYISGTLWHWQYLKHDKGDKRSTKTFLNEVLSSNPKAFDMHTKPQVRFHKNISVFIRMDDELNESLSEFLDVEVNLSVLNPCIPEEASLFNELLNDDFRQKLQEFYVEDYDLWNRFGNQSILDMRK